MTHGRPKRVEEGWVPHRHGIISSYNRGCRCDACRAINAYHQRRSGASRNLSARKFAERVEINGRMVHPNPYKGHGNLTAYTTCGCRCDECREAKTAHERVRRGATKRAFKPRPAVTDTTDLRTPFSFRQGTTADGGG